MIFADADDNGPIRRLPPAAKLLALFGLSVLLFILQSPLPLAIIAGALLLFCLVFCRAALRHWLRSSALLLTLAIVVLWTAYANGLEAGLVVLLRLGALSLFAMLVTTTTTIGQFIDTITRAAQPLEKLGLANARDIGLAIGLVIRFVPEVQLRYRAVADAHRARGLKPRPATLIVPLVIGTLQSADEIANSIDARGIRAEHIPPA